MLLYTNLTQYRAIVTINVETTEDPAAALMIGTKEFYEKFGRKSGYFDLVVDSGKELHLITNRSSSHLHRRSYPAPMAVSGRCDGLFLWAWDAGRFNHGCDQGLRGYQHH